MATSTSSSSSSSSAYQSSLPYDPVRHRDHALVTDDITSPNREFTPPSMRPYHSTNTSGLVIPPVPVPPPSLSINQSNTEVSGLYAQHEYEPQHPHFHQYQYRPSYPYSSQEQPQPQPQLTHLQVQYRPMSQPWYEYQHNQQQTQSRSTNITTTTNTSIAYSGTNAGGYNSPPINQYTRNTHGPPEHQQQISPPTSPYRVSPPLAPTLPPTRHPQRIHQSQQSQPAPQPQPPASIPPVLQSSYHPQQRQATYPRVTHTRTNIQRTHPYTTRIQSTPSYQHATPNPILPIRTSSTPTIPDHHVIPPIIESQSQSPRLPQRRLSLADLVRDGVVGDVVRGMVGGVVGVGERIETVVGGGISTISMDTRTRTATTTGYLTQSEISTRISRTTNISVPSNSSNIVEQSQIQYQYPHIYGGGSNRGHGRIEPSDSSGIRQLGSSVSHQQYYPPNVQIPTVQSQSIHVPPPPPPPPQHQQQHQYQSVMKEFEPVMNRGLVSPPNSIPKSPHPVMRVSSILASPVTPSLPPAGSSASTSSAGIGSVGTLGSAEISNLGYQPRAAQGSTQIEGKSKSVQRKGRLPSSLAIGEEEVGGGGSGGTGDNETAAGETLPKTRKRRSISTMEGGIGGGGSGSSKKISHVEKGKTIETASRRRHQSRSIIGEEEVVQPREGDNITERDEGGDLKLKDDYDTKNTDDDSESISRDDDGDGGSGSGGKVEEGTEEEGGGSNSGGGGGGEGGEGTGISFQCTVEGCGREFDSRDQLKRHRKSHRRDLQRHQATHSIQRSFICETCGTQFTRQDARHRHIKSNRCTGVRVMARREAALQHQQYYEQRQQQQQQDTGRGDGGAGSGSGTTSLNVDQVQEKKEDDGMKEDG
ncbi:hypothetical protein HDU76_005090 [Blyttiomyces sp. JEL0837]|nr:hypothetical protein HDU76_005090 [Blyttiomyces sp. JEL0837]